MSGLRPFVAGLDPTIDIFDDPRGAEPLLPPAGGSEAMPSEPSYFQRAGQILKDSFTPRLPTREDIIGRAEALGTIGSSVPAFGAGILGLIGNLAVTRDPEKALDTYRDTMEALTYMPRTEGGRERISQFGELLEPVARAYESYGSAVGERTGSPLFGEYAEEFLDPLMAIPPLAAASRTTRKVPTIKSNIVADVDEFGLYSKAENVALQLPQEKQVGADAMRYFMKQGVKREELDDLGLLDLFREPRVTQRQILDRIGERKVNFEEEISYGGTPRETDIEFEDLTFEEAFFGSDADYEIEYQRDEYIREVMPQYGPERLAEESRQLSSASDPNEVAKWAEREIEFEDLSITAQNNLNAYAREIAEDSYNQEPIRQATLTIDGEPTDYRLIQGPYDDGYYPRGDAPYFLRRAFGRAEANQNPRTVSEQEVAVELQSLAMDQGDLDLAGGETPWEEYTLPGGDNYREFRFRLPGTTLFSEDTHFRGEPNNIFHARTKDRIDDDGNKILYVEELQSDWAQTGRDIGFRDPVALEQTRQQGVFAANEVLPFVSKMTLTSPDSIARPQFLRPLQNFQERFFQTTEGDWAPRGPDYDYEQGSVDNVRRGIVDLKAFLEGDEKLRREIAFLRAEDKIFDELPRSRKIEFAEQHLNRVEAASSSSGYRNFSADEVAALSDKDLDQIALKGFKTYLAARPRALKPFLEEANVEVNKILRENGLDENLPNIIAEQIEALDPDYVRKLADQLKAPQLGPFVGNTDSWNKLAIKRLAQVAQEEGYDKIAFTPGYVQYERWPQRYDRKTQQYVDNSGIKIQYDQNIPKAIKSALGTPAKIEDIYIEYEGFVPSPTVNLDDVTVTGETVRDKVKAGQSMYAVPIAITAGGLGALGEPAFQNPEEAEGTGISALPGPSI